MNIDDVLLCIEEAGGDLEVGLLAAECILAVEEEEEETDTALLYGQPEGGGGTTSTAGDAAPEPATTRVGPRRGRAGRRGRRALPKGLRVKKKWRKPAPALAVDVTGRSHKAGGPGGGRFVPKGQEGSPGPRSGERTGKRSTAPAPPAPKPSAPKPSGLAGVDPRILEDIAENQRFERWPNGDLSYVEALDVSEMFNLEGVTPENAHQFLEAHGPDMPELVAHLKAGGQVPPIVVSRRPWVKGQIRVDILDGEHRAMAAAMAGVKVPAVAIDDPAMKRMAAPPPPEPENVLDLKTGSATARERAADKAKYAPVELSPPSGRDRASIAESLANRPIAKHYPLGGGMNATFLVETDDGEAGVWKPVEGEQAYLRSAIKAGTYYQREEAASRVAEALGFEDLVPATVTRGIGGSEGSLQQFRHGAKVAKAVDDPAAKFDGDEDLARAAAFDYLTGATDRHKGNWLVGEDGKLSLIDNGLSFPDEHVYNDFWSVSIMEEASNRGLPLPDTSSWSWEAVEGALRSSKLSDDAISAAKERFNNLVGGSRENLSFGALPSLIPRFGTMENFLENSARKVHEAKEAAARAARAAAKTEPPAEGASILRADF